MSYATARRIVPEYAEEITWEDGLDEDALTPSQRNAINKIAARALEDQSLGGRREVFIAKFKVGEVYTGPTNLTKISVVIEAGTEGDEGTMAEILCRKRGHFFVGPMGGIEIAGLDADEYEGNRTKARKHPLIYGLRYRL